jgi:hypothetical protein
MMHLRGIVTNVRTGMCYDDNDILHTAESVIKVFCCRLPITKRVATCWNVPAHSVVGHINTCMVNRINHRDLNKLKYNPRLLTKKV